MGKSTVKYKYTFGGKDLNKFDLECNVNIEVSGMLVELENRELVRFFEIAMMMVGRNEFSGRECDLDGPCPMMHATYSILNQFFATT